MLPQSAVEDCDECTPDYLNPSRQFGTKAAFSTLPFITTFALLTFVAYRKVYPLLSSSPQAFDGHKGLPRPATSSVEPATQHLARRIAASTFAATIGLSAVLTELLLCEISNSFNPTARTVALQITVASLLGLLVVAIPLLGISSVVAKSGYRFRGQKRAQVRLAWVLEFAGYAAFLLAFWAIGALLPSSASISESLSRHEGLFQACLDRLAITGVSFMALLSGFASVSAIWQCFGPRPRLVTENDITRKQAGLDATLHMAAQKREQLRALEQRSLESPPANFWGWTIQPFRGNQHTQERKILELELSGLETMSSELETSLSIMRSRHATQSKATTIMGRLSLTFSYVFALYCVCRICTTTVNIIQRMFSRTSPTSDTDPVTYSIALFARHVYPSLDRVSWAQQISFLLSGAMLLASFTAVTQTFQLFARFMPGVVHATRTNFALLISQISGMYVISSAIMLRGMMPKEVGSVINSALGAGLLEPAWVQRWFDGFFMFAVFGTAGGIFIGRKISGGLAFDDDMAWDGALGSGKQS
ncbi:hypothetical protein PV08_00145 [Exophiala spinifera]|uniref:Abscisic acid G-protein coupled receptor-like domain-containing protein n=1 Tax=Exophiala spinifera TaxID=91928 RepID=A0A0D2A3Z8_9EURO|nr:uncharacterized protein PV08_00145 [Exophiala spinifera]KIW19572.1 hypothetical protein PV08_00145 [Exophiala spinifera]